MKQLITGWQTPTQAPTCLFGRTPNEASIKVRYNSEEGEGEQTLLQRGGEMDLAPDCYGGFVRALTRDSRPALASLAPFERQ